MHTSYNFQIFYNKYTLLTQVRKIKIIKLPLKGIFKSISVSLPLQPLPKEGWGVRSSNWLEVNESWTVKKMLECQRIDAVELWCWRSLLRVPWTARRSNQSILREINPERSFIGRTDAQAEIPVFWSSDANSWFIEKIPDAGKDWGQKQKGLVIRGWDG